MSDMSPVARPYARAAFELARSQDALTTWDGQLALLAQAVEDERLRRILTDPRVDRNRKAELLLDIGANKLTLTDPVKNLVQLLAENNRLIALPAIHREFAALKAEAERLVVAQVISFRKINATQEKELHQALSDRLGCAVELNCSVDNTLIGGLIIRTGDQVIDGSVRGQLNRLAAHLSR